MSLGIDGTATTKKGEAPVNHLTVKSLSSQTSNMYWYGLYDVAKTYSNGDIKSAMVSNAQYDIMVEWFTDEEMNKSGAKAVNAVSGSEETDKVRNIYDLRGGNLEYTTAGYGTNRRISRGFYSDTVGASETASYISFCRSDMGAYSYYGTRPTLIW